MSFACPLSRIQAKHITLAHGGGGKSTSDLIENIFLPSFGTSKKDLHDGAYLSIGDSKLAFTTDSYVVQPLFFPGGTIGDLAVFGTVNDLAMCGARPLYLSCGFILEEGFEISGLEKIVASMERAAKISGVRLVTGDTKVVERSRGDGVYINTSGIGVVEMQGIRPQNIQSGDLIILNGDIGRHGIAVMTEREGLAFETSVESDVCELYTLVKALQTSGVEIHCMRDLTRGGLATAIVELAQARGLSFEIDEGQVPVVDSVRGVCEFLGLDPLYVACEGRMVVFVPPECGEQALAVMEAWGGAPRIIGKVSEDANSLVSLKTFMGTYRILDRLVGDQLPRIC